MALIDDMIAAGWLDRLIARHSNNPPSDPKRKAQFHFNTGYETRLESPYTSQRAGRAWHALDQAAIAAVERARVMRDTGDSGPIPATLDSVDSGKRLGSKSVDYHVIVVVKDMDTGGENRVMVHLNLDASATQQQIASMASTPEVIARHWTTTGQKGEVSPDKFTSVEVIILGVVGRK